MPVSASGSYHSTTGEWQHASVSLRVIPQHNRTLDINFNERFHWIKPNDLKEHYVKALAKGLPYPLLTVAEYLSLDKEGFSWGRSYRTAGYYTSIMLWSAFTTWLLSCLLLVTVPRYGAYLLAITGTLMGFACLVFWMLRPATPLVLRFEETAITFSLGWCFWLVLIWGCVIGVAGCSIATLDWVFPHRFSTILDLDFDTPYDRHTIIEDSHDTRKRRFKIPRLEEPINAGLHAGSRLLRRLSKRSTKEPSAGKHESNPAGGHDNPTFNMEEAPKSSWRTSTSILRTDSKKSSRSVRSGKSVRVRSDSQRSNNFLELPPQPTEVEENRPSSYARSDSEQSRMSIGSGGSDHKSVSFEGDIDANELQSVVVDEENHSVSRQDSTESSASTSSYGLKALSRGSSVRKTTGGAEENTHEGVTRSTSANIIVFHRTDSRGQLQRLSGEVVEIQTDDSYEPW
ncbi:uncharacterized protein LOC108668245 isoform X2 [Hyalella azteca]|uniref:Uncharacterized protein LOC108668245 isoform X2 n=1 Tax=Hyalella azteca TaxID=294128 RepID=A0A8B7NBE7_HYAAZ|nr:uncharacterized protein LOC108668245 isoform X2 [Hyalella azteca]